MNIKGFRVKNQKVQKLWIILLIAITIALILIITSFFTIFSTPKNKFNKEELFNFNSYYTKYKIVTYSNKNQNTYMMEEYCLRDNEDTSFRFNTLNSNNNYSYIVTNNTFYIKSQNQINEFKNDNYDINFSTNILSLATFINIYEKISNIIDNNLFKENYGITTKVEEKDEYISYKINLEATDKLKEQEYISEDSLNVYINKLAGDMKISALELILDKEKYIPKEYIIYTNDNKAYVDVIYEEFEFNPKIEEKVFSF